MKFYMKENDSCQQDCLTVPIFSILNTLLHFDSAITKSDTSYFQIFDTSRIDVHF